MWRSEGFPFHIFQMSEQRYNITSFWTRQEYQIKTLRLETSRVTFRRGEKTYPV